MQKTASFDIYYHQFLDPKGHLVQPLPVSFKDPAQIVPLYEAMVSTRTFDTKAIALQRTGQLGTYPSLKGHEATQIGLAYPLKPEDVFVPSYREHGAMFMRGVNMTDILLFWGGDERGSDFAIPRQDFPVSIPIATHLAHAVGVAKAFQLRGEKRVALAVCGDGGTSKGDFYEAMNFASVWNLPVVFVVINNQWAISFPRSLQTSAETLAQKAIAAGLEGIQVDGNDVIAVASVVGQAVEKARSGRGPTLIEALTYRVGDHTTADDAKRYRSTSEVEEAIAKDPIDRLKIYLMREGVWTENQENALLARSSQAVEEAVKRYHQTTPQEPTSMLDYLYEQLPKPLLAQRELIIDRSALCQKSH